MVNKGQRKKSDFYQTPYSMTQHLLDNEEFEGTILEPACGQKAIVDTLLKNEYKLHRLNYYDIGFGNNDFLCDTNYYDNIITNPPFYLSTEFIVKAKSLYRDKIAMLLPLNYLHGQKRYKLKIFDNLKTVYIFIRYPMLSDSIRDDGKYSTGMCVFAWFVWNKSWQGKPTIEWIDNNMDILKKGE